MSTTLYSARIIEGPSPSQFAIAAAEGGSEETIIRLALCEDGEILHEQWGALINFSNTRYSVHLDGMYTVRDGYWRIQYDPLRRAGHIIANSGTDDDVAAARRAFFGTRPRRFITVRHAAWLR